MLHIRRLRPRGLPRLAVPVVIRTRRRVRNCLPRRGFLRHRQRRRGWRGRSRCCCCGRSCCGRSCCGLHLVAWSHISGAMCAIAVEIDGLTRCRFGEFDAVQALIAHDARPARRVPLASESCAQKEEEEEEGEGGGGEWGGWRCAGRRRRGERAGRWRLARTYLS